MYMHMRTVHTIMINNIIHVYNIIIVCMCMCMCMHRTCIHSITILLIVHVHVWCTLQMNILLLKYFRMQ